MMADVNPERLLALAVANLQRDYPVHWTHVISSEAELVPQRVRHPVFAGSFDWHSCVHQTWLVTRLLRLYPQVEGAAQARAVLDRLITAEGCAVEAEFFAGDAGRHWERPYGWAWLFVLDAELRVGELPWAEALRPLTAVLRRRWLDWIRAARLPIRVGTHTNSAFSTGLVLDAARATGDTELAEACAEAALRWFAADRDYGAYEPDAFDFFSPALVEADLMNRVLGGAEFTAWLEAFLPDLAGPRWQALREPVPVADPTDPYESHLIGLALTRSWCWRSLGAALPAGHRFAPLAASAAETHRAAGWDLVFGNGYGADHWLGTFAAYLEIGAYSAE
ncbi:DUF2891 domain-containing protein [Kutzneria albida]|uniref:DUF2891 domain-containing protein n=1 Tax=Kutzneria albida DSM 43870 TaxID=1449976 RepID=W5W3L4_9PSEU|nr:DUF2891 domain-containing protein [Kutzneria albida]AHH95370.1 hypothetical protein KALB_2000 [Kutzneria albida DSM 43870]